MDLHVSTGRRPDTRFWRRRSALLLSVVVLAAFKAPVSGQSEAPQTTETAAVLVSDRALLASLDRISRGSPTWREAIDAVRRTGRSVLVAPLHHVEGGRGGDAFATTDLAEVVPILDRDLQIPRVVVVVNLRLLQRIHEDSQLVGQHFDADLDRIIVHEVYGHAIPYLLAGNLSGRCADPRPGEPALDACSIRRENAVRAELGLGRRLDGGLSSLTLAWARRF